MKDRARARDDLLMAAAALTQLPTRETLSFAILHAALGLMLLAKADPEHQALDHVMGRLREAKEARTE